MIFLKMVDVPVFHVIVYQVKFERQQLSPASKIWVSPVGKPRQRTVSWEDESNEDGCF